MSDMPRPRPQYLQSEWTRHGKRVWYVRVGTGPRIRIKGEYGSAEFMEAYHAAVKGERPKLNLKRPAGHWNGFGRCIANRQRGLIYRQRPASSARTS